MANTCPCSWVTLAASLPPARLSDASCVTLTRDRNGWCLYSSQLWLALEYKGIAYDTEHGASAQLQWVDGRVATDVLEAIRELDVAFPSTPPLWPPRGVDSSDVDRMVHAFAATMPAARASNRAAFLFSPEEGFSYDALSRRTFVTLLDTTEALLAERPGPGPFFCGDAFSAADVVWAPQMERYAAQLPCLHAGLHPRDGRWPRLARWYEALAKLPQYACRCKGDAQSWRKVLSTAPWWPAGWPSRGGPGERGDPRGGTLELSERAVAEAFGSVAVSLAQWREYAKPRPWVAESPAAEAAAAIVRNRHAIVRDAQAYGALASGKEGGADEAEYDLALRAVATMLSAAPDATDQPLKEEGGGGMRGTEATVAGAAALAAYLDDRLCVPRDMGAPPALAIRQLHQELNGSPPREESSCATAQSSSERRRLRF